MPWQMVASYSTVYFKDFLQCTVKSFLFVCGLISNTHAGNNDSFFLFYDLGSIFQGNRITHYPFSIHFIVDLSVELYQCISQVDFHQT